MRRVGAARCIGEEVVQLRFRLESRAAGFGDPLLEPPHVCRCALDALQCAYGNGRVPATAAMASIGRNWWQERWRSALLVRRILKETFEDGVVDVHALVRCLKEVRRTSIVNLEVEGRAWRVCLFDVAPPCWVRVVLLVLRLEASHDNRDVIPRAVRKNLHRVPHPGSDSR